MTIRAINASIKRHFGEHSQFAPAKADMVGNIPAIRFEGDLPMSLVQAIAKHVEFNFPSFAGDVSQRRSFAFIEGGTVINWYS